MITQISTDDLRKMKGSEGLIIQGCGDDLNQWVDGINDLLTKAGILPDGKTFTDVSQFSNDGVTCLLFKFTDDLKQLDVGKLAIWRLQTHEAFGGTWLSDYVPNRLGGFISNPSGAERKKPDCELIGKDGNIFNLVGIAARTLNRNGMSDEAKEMSSRVFASGDYNEAICIIGEYVNIVGSDGNFDEDFDGDLNPMTM